jgi:hypothetical protein
MALGSVLTDKARIQRRLRTGERIEGRFVETAPFSPYIRCRYTPSQGSKSRTAASVRHTQPAIVVMKAASLRRIGLGQLLPSDRIEITSNELTAPTVMEIMGTPEPIRKRRTVIGWQAMVQLVKESQA